MAKFGELPITQKEVLLVVLACAVWGKQWQERRVLVNEAVVTVLNSGYSRDPQIMHLLYAVCFLKIKAHFLTVVHILGKNNVMADAISRDLLTVQVPTPHMYNHSSTNVERQPDWISVNWTCYFHQVYTHHTTIISLHLQIVHKILCRRG